MIIWGWGRRTIKQHGSALHQRCPNCGNSGWFQWMTVRRWFTLFFIPLIPYSRRDLLICPVCSRGLELDKARRQQVQQMAAATAELQGGTLDQTAYQARIAQISAGNGATTPPAALPQPPTATAAGGPLPVVSAGLGAADPPAVPDQPGPLESTTDPVSPVAETEPPRGAPPSS
jgi:hypothetical protein